MYELKTKETNSSVIQFIEAIDNVTKREDAYRLLDIFTKVTGYDAKMWGESIIGFGKYHYKYKTGHEGDSLIVGFSPRKARISLYLAPYDNKREKILELLGKHKEGKSCVYINKVADIDTKILEKLIEESVAFINKLYPDN